MGHWMVLSMSSWSTKSNKQDCSFKSESKQTTKKECVTLPVVAAKRKLQHDMLPTNQQHLERRIKPQKALELLLSVFLPHVLLTVITSSLRNRTGQQQVVDYDFNEALICFHHLRLLLLFAKRERKVWRMEGEKEDKKGRATYEGGAVLASPPLEQALEV